MTGRRIGLVSLGLAALASRLLWALWAHPPQETVASDMAGYVERAQALAEQGTWLFGGTATLFPPGTHWILAAGWWAGGATGGAALWALLSAATPVLAWILAEEVSPRRWMGPALGVLLLVWPPHLSLSGYFLSETPFTALCLLATWLLARTLRRGSGAGGAGVALAAAFLVRPQVALLGVLAAIGPLRGRWGSVVRLGLPGVLAAGLLVGMHHRSTGDLRLTGNASLNQAISRCAALRLEFYPTRGSRDLAERGEPAPLTWWMEPPALRERAAAVPAHHPLAVRPVLGPGPVRIVGGIHDAELLERLASRCVQESGAAEQVRAAVVRVGLLWWGRAPWPESTWSHATQEAAVVVAHALSRWVVLPLALVGALQAVRRRRERPEGLLAPLHLAGLLAVAAWYFGSLRLRTWADPYLLLLALEAAADGWGAVRRWLSGPGGRAAPGS